MPRQPFGITLRVAKRVEEAPSKTITGIRGPGWLPRQVDSGRGSEGELESEGNRCPKQARPTWNKAQAETSIIGVRTGCLCHLNNGRPVEQEPRDEV